MSDAKPAGCLTYLAFLIGEIVAFVLCLAAGYGAAQAVLGASTAWSVDRIANWSTGAGLIAGIVGAVLIDRWCKATTGDSILTALGELPPWP